MERKDELTLLGSKTEYRQDYAPEVLESFVNKHPGNIILPVLGLRPEKGQFIFYQFVSYYRTARFCGNPYLLPA